MAPVARWMTHPLLKGALRMVDMHPTAAWILLIFLIASVAVILILLHRTRAGRILHERIPDRPRRRLFLAALGFVLTFLGVRLLVLLILFHIGPFGWVILGGRHIHHLVWGILLLLISGYAMVAEIGTDATPRSLFFGRLIAIVYGMGAALTLDEFQMWLDIKESAWSFSGRESIDAVVLFGALLALGAWGAPLWTQRPRKRRKRNHRRSDARNHTRHLPADK
ncbi:MAG: hypothetical protein ACLGXA_12290 [Acidobacteriota bacterium]